MAALSSHCLYGYSVLLVMGILIRLGRGISPIDAGGSFGILAHGFWATFRWIPH